MKKNFFHDKWDCYIGKRVRILNHSTRYPDLKQGATGVWQFKDVEIAMFAILIDGEEKPRLFSVFDYEFIEDERK